MAPGPGSQGAFERRYGTVKVALAEQHLAGVQVGIGQAETMPENRVVGVARHQTRRESNLPLSSSILD